VPVKANSGVRARVPAAGKVLEGDDKPTLLREDQHYLHYIRLANFQPSISESIQCHYNTKTNTTNDVVHIYTPIGAETGEYIDEFHCICPTLFITLTKYR